MTAAAPLLLSVLKSRWFHYAALLVLCLVLWQRAASSENAASAWKHAAAAQENATVAVAAASKAKAIAQRLKTENEFAQAAMEADHEIQALRSDYAARTDAYARAHLVQPAPAATTGTSGPGASGASGTAAGDDGPRREAELVAVPRADLDILVGNTARLVTVQGFGLDLIERGLAVTEANFTRTPETGK